MPAQRRPLRPRVLLIENDPNRHRWFDDRLRGGLPNCALVWCQTGGKALQVLKQDPPDIYVGLMLDHDLDVAGLPNTANGLKVVKRLVELWPRPVLVHSANTTGGPAMRDALVSAGFTDVTRTAFYDLDGADFARWMAKVADYAESMAD
jgi:hypothetical protein